ncbi:MAG: DUF1223 domain-containing protein [Pseudomonadota bacterium]
MKKLLHVSVLAGLMALAAPATQAGDNVVVVELFTSQGCSSCPPADRNLGALADRDDVLALSMHVDYWDYLGWRDTFGKRKYTERQYEYRRLMGARVVYTPQMIIQGAIDVPGYRPDMIEAAVSQAGQVGHGAGIQIEKVDGMLEANIAGGQAGQDCTIWVASYAKTRSVGIERGENAGETITYHNVVEDLMQVGPWRGGNARTINLPKPGDGEGVAVWVQDNATGEIVTASFTEN